MTFRFTGTINTEGTRAFVKIPFNVWEETGLKGNIPCRVTIDDIPFECKLVPKGNGNYLIPITKKILSSFVLDKEYEIEMEPIEGLTRINKESPYSKENPIRKIDSIESIPIKKGLCGQSVVAMLSGVSLDDVVSLMGKDSASWSKILEALDYYGISYAPKAIYTRGEAIELPECCILNNDNGFLLWYKGSFFGREDVDPKKTVSYIEVYI